MPASEPRVSIDAIRREAQLACEGSSLRAVAREVGMTPMGLRGFIRGENTPQPRTVRKLTAWYVKRMASPQAQGEEAVRAALTVLLAQYPPDDRKRVEKRFLELMVEQFEASAMTPPAWLLALLRRAD